MSTNPISRPSLADNAIATPAQADADAANPSPRPRWGTFDDAALEHRLSSRSIRTYAAKGMFALYRVPGRRGVLLDLNEVALAMAKMPRRHRKPKYGENAIIRTITLGGQK